LQLPTTEISDIIYDLLNKQEATQSFIYKHDQGNEAFKTIALHFGDQHFVIAKVTENITPSFLVTLRNAMSLQQAEWKNASLVLLTASLNDSIKDGSINLVSEGMPLYVENFIRNLEEVIKTKVGNPTAQRVIEHFLSKREREYKLDNTSFLDFEEVLDIANKEKITSSDYKSLEYFPDKALDQLLNDQALVLEGSKNWRDLNRE